jgi:hypothetical protein
MLAVSVVPSEDEHQVGNNPTRTSRDVSQKTRDWMLTPQSEEVGDSDKRREYISG